MVTLSVKVGAAGEVVLVRVIRSTWLVAPKEATETWLVKGLLGDAVMEVPVTVNLEMGVLTPPGGGGGGVSGVVLLDGLHPAKKETDYRRDSANLRSLPGKGGVLTAA